eukprot:9495451-Pyramimonas_sp.AAC.3
MRPRRLMIAWAPSTLLPTIGIRAYLIIMECRCVKSRKLCPTPLAKSSSSLLQCVPGRRSKCATRWSRCPLPASTAESY